MRKIYFDAVRSMDKYGKEFYEDVVVKSLDACASDEDKAKWLVVECANKIRNYQDLKVCLALVYNYMPGKYLYLGDYESTAFLIMAYANGSINQDEFYSKTRLNVRL